MVLASDEGSSRVQKTPRARAGSYHLIDGVEQCSRRKDTDLLFLSAADTPLASQGAKSGMDHTLKACAPRTLILKLHERFAYMQTDTPTVLGFCKQPLPPQDVSLPPPR